MAWPGCSTAAHKNQLYDSVNKECRQVSKTFIGQPTAHSHRNLGACVQCLWSTGEIPVEVHELTDTVALLPQCQGDHCHVIEHLLHG